MWNEYPDDAQEEPAFGLGGFIGFEFDPQPFESGIESGPAAVFDKFDLENSPTPNPGDRTQWAYERLYGVHSRWAYEITEADYRFAVEHPQDIF